MHLSIINSCLFKNIQLKTGFTFATPDWWKITSASNANRTNSITRETCWNCWDVLWRKHISVICFDLKAGSFSLHTHSNQPPSLVMWPLPFGQSYDVLSVNIRHHMQILSHELSSDFDTMSPLKFALFVMCLLTEKTGKSFKCEVYYSCFFVLSRVHWYFLCPLRCCHW